MALDCLAFKFSRKCNIYIIYRKYKSVALSSTGMPLELAATVCSLWLGMQCTAKLGALELAIARYLAQLKDGSYSAHVEINPQGLGKLIVPKLLASTEGTLSEKGEFLPENYSFTRSGMFYQREEKTKFDHTTSTQHFESARESKTTKLKPDVVDPLTAFLQFVLLGKVEKVVHSGQLYELELAQSRPGCYSGKLKEHEVKLSACFEPSRIYGELSAKAVGLVELECEPAIPDRAAF